jgi:quaternary ammonium compound-resistance protein SugE
MNVSLSWIMLVIAGLTEILMTLCLKATEGFTRPVWIAAFLVTGGISMVLLSRAITVIPVGTAYAVWTGIGAAGTAAIGMIWFKEPATAFRLFFIVTLIGSIVGLKIVSE